MRAIRIHRVGGPEVLQLEDVARPSPGPGQATVRIETAGVNFIDIYHRTGLYPAALPFTPGMDGAGVVEAVGQGVSGLREGERVAFAMSMGSYAEVALVDAWKLVPLPAAVDFASATAGMVQGLTAHYLVRSTFPIRAGHTALIHAAAGGVGLLLVQLAKRFGARVIGTVSTEEKARAARKAGADEVILYNKTDFEAGVRDLTQGRGVDVVYDSVGKETFEKSLKCLAPRGLLVSFGQSSGPVGAFDPLLLSAQGSLFLTRPRLNHYCRDRRELLERAGDVMHWIGSGELEVTIDREVPLEAAEQAHRLLESRKTRGKILLKP